MKDIDFVFLWVNPDDPKWKKRRDDFLKSHPETPADAFLPIHFANHDELRFAIRSVIQFAPFFRKIFLVTARQRPSWLKDDPRLVLVDHRDFFNPDTPTPVFSPEPIESQLHRIPGLSEQFVYSNDDTFLAKPVTRNDFFDDDGTPIVRMSGERVKIPVQKDIKWRWVWYNAVVALTRAFGNLHGSWNYTDHQMFAMRKSVCKSAEKFFTKEFHHIRMQQYRNRNEISPIALIYYWAIHEKAARSVLAKESLYIDTPLLDSKFRADLQKLLLPVEQRPKFVCLNDNAPVENAEKIYSVAKEYLTKLFPEPSFLER